jgi:hypothetical protein
MIKMENKYDNSGSLNKNTYKTKEGQPDYRGKAMIAGVRYQLGAWLKTGKDGDQFLSINFKLIEEGEPPNEGVKRYTSKSVGSASDLNDLVPF